MIADIVDIIAWGEIKILNDGEIVSSHPVIARDRDGQNWQFDFVTRRNGYTDAINEREYHASGIPEGYTFYADDNLSTRDKFSFLQDKMPGNGFSKRDTDSDHYLADQILIEALRLVSKDTPFEEQCEGLIAKFNELGKWYG